MQIINKIIATIIYILAFIGAYFIGLIAYIAWQIYV